MKFRNKHGTPLCVFSTSIFLERTTFKESDGLIAVGYFKMKIPFRQKESLLSSRLIKNWSTIKPNSQLLLACQVALQITKTFFLSFPALKNGQISYRA